MTARWWIGAVVGPDDYMPARRYLLFAPGIVLLLAYLKLRRVL